MKTNIIPIKIATINQHKTRKEITNSTYKSKILISKAMHLISLLKIANNNFSKLHIKYLKDCNIIFYSPKKIILGSTNIILKTKVKELHSEFIQILNKEKLFSKLEIIEIQINYKQKQTYKKTIKKTNSKIENYINELKKIFN